MITYVTADGKFEEKEFDGVILSVGFTPPQAFKDLAKRIGLQLNPQGFCQTEEFNPAQTSVKGIFVGGAFRSPRDIRESVVEGSSAAAMVAPFLSPNGLQPKKEYPGEGALSEEIPKVGVFICHCGDELRKRLSISELLNETKKLREVVHVEEVGLPCLPDDMEVIKRKRQRATGWRIDPAESAGALFEGGIHWVNFAGALGFTIASVKAARAGRHEGLERSMALLIQYAEGPVGQLSYSWDVASVLGGLRASRIYGLEGSLVFESNGLFVATSGRRWRIRFPGLGDMLGYHAMFADFLKAWRARTEAAMTLARARRDLEVVEEAYRSAGVTKG